MITDKSLIGRGPSFPYNKSPKGGLDSTEGIDRINQSLFILFETPKGSRLMLPEFGSDIHRYKFEPLDKVLMERIKSAIQRDVKRWIPYISIDDIEFLTEDNFIDNNILYISLTYNIIGTDIKGNYVYPYKMNTYYTIEASSNQGRW